MRCEWCGGPRRPAQKNCCGASCRAARHRWLNDIHTGTNPPAAPPWADSPLHGRRGELKPPPPPSPRSGANARSGLILSYPKAVEAAQDALAVYVADSNCCTESEARDLIERALRGALSDRMRATLAAREAHN